jgi:hypothetical protein
MGAMSEDPRLRRRPDVPLPTSLEHDQIVVLIWQTAEGLESQMQFPGDQPSRERLATLLTLLAEKIRAGIQSWDVQ